ncbi:hypothetical protein NW069_03265 [Mycoplasmopsis cynos]|uniref:hypothetical protein n=1 Tax=Mycoplasmopsis cynos TaxID=171284 RepID=UPI00220F5F93|nr:hypothetical protein [Mycoplasmopsis cynos]UWV80341.1 hypothetical protein NW069_03265 [Mycoplasmopsis cynos]
MINLVSSKDKLVVKNFSNKTSLFSTSFLINSSIGKYVLKAAKFLISVTSNFWFDFEI